MHWIGKIFILHQFHRCVQYSLESVRSMYRYIQQWHVQPFHTQFLWFSVEFLRILYNRVQQDLKINKLHQLRRQPVMWLRWNYYEQMSHSVGIVILKKFFILPLILNFIYFFVCKKSGIDGRVDELDSIRSGSANEKTGQLSESMLKKCGVPNKMGLNKDGLQFLSSAQTKAGAWVSNYYPIKYQEFFQMVWSLIFLFSTNMKTTN